MFTCLIDQAVFPTEYALHSHISRRLKVKLEDYYARYFPRKDLLTGEPIKFKEKDVYFHSLFNSRANLINYLKVSDNPEKIIKETLALRKQLKELHFAPSTIECRTSLLPTPFMVKSLGFNFNEICEDLGFDVRYDYQQQLSFEEQTPLKVLIDTREQNPLKFKNSVVSKLDFGDYTTTSHYKRVFVERKSLIDLLGTLSGGFERFEREMQRAADMEAYVVVCVEEPLRSLDDYKDRPEFKKVKATTEFISSRMRTICQSFDNVQFLFVNGRQELGAAISKIFRMNNLISNTDLQFYYDTRCLV